MASFGNVPNLAPTFNTSKFLYSIASHTRVLVSALKTEQKTLRRKASFYRSPAPDKENQLVVSSKTLRPVQSEQLLVLRPVSTTVDIDIRSAASPNAGSLAKREHNLKQQSRSGCCYLCDIDEANYDHDHHHHAKSILPSSPPRSRSPSPLSESRCIEYPTSSRPHSPESLQIALDEDENAIIPSLVAPPSRAELRKTLAEINTNLLPASAPPPLVATIPKRVKLLPLPLTVVSDSPTRRPASTQVSATPRNYSAREDRKRVSYADKSFFSGDEEDISPCRSSPPRRFARGAKPQPFLLAPPPPPKRKASINVTTITVVTNAANPPCPPRRKSSLGFSMRPLTISFGDFKIPDFAVPPPASSLPIFEDPYQLVGLSKALGSPQNSRALTPFTTLTPQQGIYLQSLILMVTPSSPRQQADPIWTALLQVATTEDCFLDVCLKAGKVYTERKELREWCDPVARNIDCSRAVKVLNAWLRRGGKGMRRMAKYLAERLVLERGDL